MNQTEMKLYFKTSSFYFMGLPVENFLFNVYLFDVILKRKTFNLYSAIKTVELNY